MHVYDMYLYVYNIYMPSAYYTNCQQWSPEHVKTEYSDTSEVNLPAS